LSCEKKASQYRKQKSTAKKHGEIIKFFLRDRSTIIKESKAVIRFITNPRVALAVFAFAIAWFGTISAIESAFNDENTTPSRTAPN
jgi:hypothetical protein